MSAANNVSVSLRVKGSTYRILQKLVDEDNSLQDVIRDILNREAKKLQEAACPQS